MHERELNIFTALNLHHSQDPPYESSLKGSFGPSRRFVATVPWDEQRARPMDKGLDLFKHRQGPVFLVMPENWRYIVIVGN